MMSVSHFRLFLAFLVTLEIVSCQLVWEEIKPDANGTNVGPVGRRDHAMVYDAARNRILVFGGKKTDMDFLDDTWQFDLTTRNWTEIPTTTRPEKRFSMVYGLTRGYFYMSTGEGTDGTNRIFYNDIWKFDLVANTWTKIDAKGTPPSEVYGATGGVYSSNSEIFFVTHGLGLIRHANAFHFNVLTETWKEVYGDKSSYSYGHPNGRCLQGGAMVSEIDHVFYGGCRSGGDSGGACPALDSWKYDGAKSEWIQLNHCASPRVYPSLALLPVVGNKKRIVMYGGGESNDQVLQVDKADPDQVAVLDVAAHEWQLKRTFGVPPKKRVGASMIQHPQGLLVFGGSFMNDIWLLRGNADSADGAPLHLQTCKKPFAGTLNLIMLHGVFMVIGWGIMLQMGAFIARYFRKRDPMWFHLHRILQTLGLLFAIAGFICGVRSVRFDHFAFGHGGLGLFIMIVGLLQPLNAFIRPHKEKDEDPSVKRFIWEIIHINSGRVALIAAVVQISLGLLQSQAFEGHHIAWHLYVAVFVVLYVIMEIKMRMSGGKSMSSNVEMR